MLGNLITSQNPKSGPPFQRLRSVNSGPPQTPPIQKLKNQCHFRKFQILQVLLLKAARARPTNCHVASLSHADTWPEPDICFHPTQTPTQSPSNFKINGYPPSTCPSVTLTLPFHIKIQIHHVMNGRSYIPISILTVHSLNTCLNRSMTQTQTQTQTCLSIVEEAEDSILLLLLFKGEIWLGFFHYCISFSGLLLSSLPNLFLLCRMLGK